MELDALAKVVVRELSGHWCRNPLACDTPFGMQRWWLRASAEISVESVMAALTWMKQQGLVEELCAADGRIRYRRASRDVEPLLQRLAAGFDVGDDASDTLH